MMEEGCGRSSHAIFLYSLKDWLGHMLQVMLTQGKHTRLFGMLQLLYDDIAPRLVLGRCVAHVCGRSNDAVMRESPVKFKKGKLEHNEIGKGKLRKAYQSRGRSDSQAKGSLPTRRRIGDFGCSAVREEDADWMLLLGGFLLSSFHKPLTCSGKGATERNRDETTTKGRRYASRSRCVILIEVGVV